MLIQLIIDIVLLSWAFISFLKLIGILLGFIDGEWHSSIGLIGIPIVVLIFAFPEQVMGALIVLGLIFAAIGPLAYKD